MLLNWNVVGKKIGLVVDIDSAIMVKVCGKICSKICGKISGKICGQIEKLLDWNRNLCGSRYWPPNYDSGLW